MSVNHEYGTAFWHIPKTAGSSMGQLPFVTIGNRFPDGRLFPVAEKALESSPEWWSTYFKFSFVRNPLDRFVSAYYYFDQMGPVRMKALRPKRKRAVLAVKACRTFHEFCETFTASDEICRDIHFRPQHSWICDQAGNILVDFVGRFECLGVGIDLAASTLGLPPVILPHILKGKHPHWKECYTAEGLEVVSRYYSRDFEIFHYPRPVGVT